MSFWEDMSPGVKRYLIIGVIVIIGVFSFRKCIGPESDANPPPRGAQPQ